MFSPRQPKSKKIFALLGSLFAVLALTAQTRAQAVPAARSQRATIVLNVPLDALVWIDGVRTRKGGLTRTFVTPPLAAGRKYGYNLRVTWVEGGRAREINRHITFRAGDRLTFALSQPNRAQFAQDLYLDPAAPAPWRSDYYLDPLNSPNYPNFLFPGSVLRPR